MTKHVLTMCQAPLFFIYITYIKPVHCEKTKEGDQLILEQETNPPKQSVAEWTNLLLVH